MFRVKWDPMNNGILLSEYIEEKDAINSPRPVYVDELKMLGIDEQIVLPTENVPVCWEIDHKYYYCGSVIAETSGGNIYQTPTVKIMDDAVGKFLMPIDIELLWKRNENALSTLENEAMDFINEQYEKYQDKPISGYVVAFSGGKDSQVILDLVSRVIPPEKYTVVFTNTGMELPCTIDTVENTEKYYKNMYPEFKLVHAKSDKDALELWKNMDLQVVLVDGVVQYSRLLYLVEK